MHPFPHTYRIDALAAPTGVVTVRGQDLEDISSSAPPEFGGPAGNWSPETLLVAAVADCFVLSFRAVAAASKLEWLEIDASATGTLDRTPEGTRFTRIDVSARLRVPPGTDAARAKRLLEKAEKVCPVSRSLSAEVHLKAEVVA